ncbi:hypothetical protein, partial [Escherichia coli]|uniref:hypothetical protein n=1 Tax=Escherichia coli TaxID=562 RepID=UPI00098C3CF2
TADRNRSHWSTSKTPSYTKSVSWQHHQDDVDPKNATEERHCCWQIEEVSGFVTPEKRSPAIIAGGAVQLIIVCL